MTIAFVVGVAVLVIALPIILAFRRGPREDERAWRRLEDELGGAFVEARDFGRAERELALPDGVHIARTQMLGNTHEVRLRAVLPAGSLPPFYVSRTPQGALMRLPAAGDRRTGKIRWPCRPITDGNLEGKPFHLVAEDPRAWELWSEHAVALLSGAKKAWEVWAEARDDADLLVVAGPDIRGHGDIDRVKRQNELLRELRTRT